MIYILIDANSCAALGQIITVKNSPIKVVYISNNSSDCGEEMTFACDTPSYDIYSKLPGEIVLVLGPNHTHSHLSAKLRSVGCAVYNTHNIEAVNALLAEGWHDSW